MVPQCPYCEKPTKISYISSLTTLIAYHPTYDENGNKISYDPNTKTHTFHCLECDRDFNVIEKEPDTYDYIIKEIDDEKNT